MIRNRRQFYLLLTSVILILGALWWWLRDPSSVFASPESPAAVVPKTLPKARESSVAADARAQSQVPVPQGDIATSASVIDHAADLYAENPALLDALEDLESPDPQVREQAQLELDQLGLRAQDFSRTQESAAR
jgi:hypothetical protein